MTIESLIRKSFSDGLEYDDAAQLCLALYSCGVPQNELVPECSKENLSLLFSGLVSDGLIRVDDLNTAALYGANFHDPTDKGHWVEIIASIFKKGNTVDIERGQDLVARLTKG